MAGPVRENYREDVAGRANVEDTPERNACYDTPERFDAAALLCFNDLPVMRAPGLYREEAFGENAAHQPVH